jgi:hypothetical protein
VREKGTQTGRERYTEGQREGQGHRRTGKGIGILADRDKDGHGQGLRLIGPVTQTSRDMSRDTDRQGQ